MNTATLPCPTCSGVGTDTFEDRHAGTRRDICSRCGGEGTIPARTGETPEASFRPVNGNTAATSRKVLPKEGNLLPEAGNGQRTFEPGERAYLARWAGFTLGPNGAAPRWEELLACGREAWARVERACAAPEGWTGMAQDEARIIAWITDRFGIGSALDLFERADRLLEEAVEAQQAAYAYLGNQAEGFIRAEALVSHVYEKPPGDPAQEMGGVITCALALAHRLGVKLDLAAQAELTRIEGLSKDHFDKRHQAKVDAGVAAQHVRPVTAGETL